ncbi:fungal pheromone STE3G-protein-coupled receptor [Artomyces pyxidatus]|uniref:Fungal pheromone STE3G-protein-coupled receptor n=1 Tax=Artomyces pyxidatus TaxID=48021 RepID=A0ACB8SXS7_9AGAM|nr:fungal pheromone STE3G-protein-coupled receptor [Artomyces pyxidatus]
MYDPSNSAFSVFAFLGLVLSLIPFYWHLQAANVGTCLYMFWSALGCLNLFVNSRVWNGNTTNRAPVWCDISTRLILAENVAIPAAVLCITRQLLMVTSLTTGTVINKRREALIDLAVGLGIPIVEVALSYIVQGHRFDIAEDIGCWPAIINAAPAYPLLFAWPLIIAVVSASFGLCALYRFVYHGRELRRLLAVDKASKSRYIRLIILASSDVFGTIPMSVYNIYGDTTAIDPWVSWQWVHYDFSEVNVYPAAVWRASTRFVVVLEITRWSTVLCAFLFFVLFGTFSQEAIERYQRACRSVRSWVGRLVPCISPSPTQYVHAS